MLQVGVIYTRMLYGKHVSPRVIMLQLGVIYIHMVYGEHVSPRVSSRTTAVTHQPSDLPARARGCLVKGRKFPNHWKVPRDVLFGLLEVSSFCLEKL